MTKYALLLAVLALGGLAAPAWADPTIVNGDFETGADMFNTFPGYYGFYTPPVTQFPPGTNPNDIPGWTHTGGGGLVPGTQPGNPDSTFRDNGDNPTNAAFIQGTGSLSQEISGFVVGTTYQLDFDYNARQCCGDFPNLTVSIQDPITLRTWTYNDSFVQPVDPHAVHVTPWNHGRFTFRASTDTLDLTITSFTINSGDGTLVIDNVAVSVAQ